MTGYLFTLHLPSFDKQSAPTFIIVQSFAQMSEYHPYKQGECSKTTRSDSNEPENSAATKGPQTNKASKRIRPTYAFAEERSLAPNADDSKYGVTNWCLVPPASSEDVKRSVQMVSFLQDKAVATDHLQRKLARFEARMHALEDALAITQKTYNLKPSPLLSNREEEDYIDAQALKSIQEESEQESLVLSDGSGSLHVSGTGINRFFGPSGAPESLLLDTVPQEERLKPTSSPRLPELDNSYLPPEIIHFTRAFPLTPPNIPTASTQRSIESFLPPVERAVALCDTFLENLSWMFHIVSRQLLVSELIPAIYKAESDYGPHDLALLFIVLGIGVLVDTNLEPYNLEAQHFYHLARAALVLQPVLVDCSIVTVKVLHLMSIHNGLSGQESNLEQSYALLNLAGQVATRIGFHVDPASWKFQGREVYDRRVYFWNLLAAILWTSLVTGRPPGIYPEFIDCKIPTMEEEVAYQQGEFPIGFGVWGFQATANCLLPLVETTLAAKSPSYESVLELDAKIRQSVAPPTPDNDPQDERTAISMRTFVRSHYQQLMLLYLHRGFFTQAMSEYPSNPLFSPYRKSVITAYESACAVLDDTRLQFQKKPVLCARIWRIWSFAFAAAVIVGTVATRGAHLNLEPQALEQFGSACEVFRNAAEISNRAARASPVLHAMLQKAIEAQKTQRSPVRVEMAKGFPSDRPQAAYAAQPLLRSTNDDHHKHVYQPFSEPTYVSGPPSLPKISTNFTEKDEFPASPLDPYTYALNRPLSSPTPLIPRNTSDRRNLSQSWGGLFHEVPTFSTQDINSHKYKRGPTLNASYGEGTMIHDRWSSFMDYNVLDERANHVPIASRGQAQFQR
ncbi:hypothetical protein D9757_000804 [Collybiopsis confluens]|uniref:Xylanolytic transcriptional activator regulatory domain-containing protein n=1 Tax=Collybiopsis confluens TaxID=2823264 RepID=A0A8H5I0H6_9AGAR|nr:hypothetical protein D9757_000804 [Collybiopsis confluens]